jgi:hypothetical protein
MCKGFIGSFPAEVTNRHNGNSGLYQAYVTTHFIQRRRWDIPIVSIARKNLGLMACFFLSVYAERIFDSLPQIDRYLRLTTNILLVNSQHSCSKPCLGRQSSRLYEYTSQFIFNVIPIWR